MIGTLGTQVRLRRAINFGKRPPVRQWARADDGSEVFAHHRGRPEAASAATCSMDNSVVSSSRCARRTRACASHAAGVAPTCSRKRRLSVLVLIASARDDWEGELAREVLFYPCEQRRHGAGRFRWRRMFDELRLPTCAFERHHR